MTPRRAPAFLFPALAAAALALTACAPDLPPPDAAGNLVPALVPRTGDAPPSVPAGACWSAETAPAVIETVTEQVQTAPESRAADGTLIAPAAFRTETRQRIVQERREVWVETVCADLLTVDFVSSLQRAFRARGLFPQPLTGAMDEATLSAVRAWQRPRGLDSGTLARATAVALGLLPEAPGPGPGTP